MAIIPSPSRLKTRGVVEKLAMRGWRTSDVKTDRLGTVETKRAAAGVRSARVNALAANIFAIGFWRGFFMDQRKVDWLFVAGL